MEPGFFSRGSIAMINTITGSGINQFNKFGESSLGDKFFLTENSGLKGFDTGSHTAFSRTVSRPSFQVLMMPLHGGFGIRQYYKPQLFHFESKDNEHRASLQAIKFSIKSSRPIPQDNPRLHMHNYDLRSLEEGPPTL